MRSTDVNGGEKILLRLRPAWASDTFYDEDQVVRVILHEVIVPNNASHSRFVTVGLSSRTTYMDPMTKIFTSF